MARPYQIIGGARASLVAAFLLTALPLGAQEQTAPSVPAPPVAAPPVVDGAGAPALPGSIAGSAGETAPVLPSAETGAPVIPGATTGTTTSPQEAPAPAATEPAGMGEAAEDTTADNAELLAPGEAEAGGDHRRGPGEGRRGGGEHRGGPEASGGPGGSPLPHDLSPWGMFMAADIVVKVVMIALAIAAFVTFTILVYKTFELAFARRSLRRAQRVIRDAVDLPRAAKMLSGRRDPAAFMALAALDELKKSAPALDVAGTDGVKERTRSIIERTEAQAGRRLMRGTGLLASIGSVSPFVGLFGTVWGILNAFIGISKSQTTNLAVVAPGIAEALLATAIGLVAAIPAVLVYNHFSRQIQGYRLALGDAGAGVERLLSRDLDFRHLATSAE